MNYEKKKSFLECLIEEQTICEYCFFPSESDTSTSSAAPNVGSDGGRGSLTEGPGRLDSRGGLGGDRPGDGGVGLEGDRPGAGGLGGRGVGQMAPMLKPRLGDMYQEESEEDGESSINLYN